MSGVEDTLWDYLVEHYAADEVVLGSPEPSTTHRSALIGAGLAGLAAIAAAVTLLFATTGTEPAFALTPHADGSYTLTINDVATAVPQINAKFQQYGIRAKAVPVTPDCKTKNTGIPLVNLGATSFRQSVTIDNSGIPAGSTAYVAVERTPSGTIGEAIGTTANPIPACLNSSTPLATATPGAG